MNKEKLEKYRKRLLDEKERLEKQLMEIDERMKHSGHPDQPGETNYDDELSDSGVYTFEREKDLTISIDLKDLLNKTDRALSKIETDQNSDKRKAKKKDANQDFTPYGECEKCGKKIPEKRLQVVPYATRCIDCKREDEKRRR